MKKQVVCSLIIGAMCLGALSVKAEVDLWPFLEINKNFTSICYPAYYQEGNYKQILNFYVRSNEGQDHHIFWPFIKMSNGRIVRVAPFWFSKAEHDFIFFPFIWQDRYSTIWTIPPVYLKNNNNFQAVIPFYIKNRNDLFIFPDLYLSDNSKRRKTMIFPFFMSKSSKAEEVNNEFWLMPFHHQSSLDNRYHFNALYPVYASEKKEDNQYTWCLNYYSRNCPDYDKKALYPFFYRKKSSEPTDASHFQLFNYYRKNSANNKFWTLLPFISYDHTEDRKTVWCLNSIYEKHADSKQFTFFPFYNFYHSQKSDKINNFYLFPFVHEWKSDGSLSKYLVPFLFDHSRCYDVDNDYQLTEQRLTIFNYSYQNNKNKRTRLLFPFYCYENNIAQAEKSLWLMPFYRHWKPDGSYNKQFFLPFYASQQDGDSNYFWAFNYYQSESKNRSSLAVFPFYGHKEQVVEKNGRKHSSMWLLWPFYERQKIVDAEGKLIKRNNRFLFFSNNIENGKRTLSIFGRIISERVN